LVRTLLKGWDEDHDLSLPWHDVVVVSDHDGVKTFRGGRCRSPIWKPNQQTRQRWDGEAFIDGEQETLVVPGTRSQQSDLLTWCKRYCGDPASVKSYAILPLTHVHPSIHLLSADTVLMALGSL
jgi:hypothetical protein